MCGVRLARRRNVMLQGCRDCGRFSSLLGKPSHAISRMEASRNDNRQQTVAPNHGHKYADRRIGVSG